MIKSLYGIVSDQTVFELLNQVTGVDAADELKRLKEQENLEQPEPRLDPVDEVVDDEREVEPKSS